MRDSITNQKHKLMKQYKFKTILLTLLLAIIFTVTHGQTAKEQLVGTWVFDYNISSEKMDTDAKAHYGKMDDTAKAQLKEAYKGRVIKFGADGSYKLQLADGRNQKGSWVLNENGKDIIITDERGKTQYQKIKTITATILVLKPKGIGYGKMILSEWYFNKN